jgi:hypothetical protein
LDASCPAASRRVDQLVPIPDQIVPASLDLGDFVHNARPALYQGIKLIPQDLDVEQREHPTVVIVIVLVLLGCRPHPLGGDDGVPLVFVDVWRPPPQQQ